MINDTSLNSTYNSKAKSSLILDGISFMWRLWCRWQWLVNDEINSAINLRNCNQPGREVEIHQMAVHVLAACCALDGSLVH